MQAFRVIIAFSILALCSGVVSAAEYYVAPNGGNGAGTEADPWSLSHANEQLRPGDKAILRGGIYQDQVIKPARSGTSDSNRIIYEAYSGEDPAFRATSFTQAPIEIEDRSYITIDGISADGEGIYKDSKYDHWVYFDNTTHCILKNLHMVRSEGYSAIRFVSGSGSEYNQILDSYFDYNGTWNVEPWKGEYDDSGSMLWLYQGNRYNLIQGNTFRRSGHDLFIVEGSYNIFRQNTYDNDWGIYKGPNFVHKEGDIDDGDRVGNRSGQIRLGSGNVFEENLFKNVPESVDNSYVGMVKVTGTYQIIRKNVFTNAVSYGVTASLGSTAPIIRDNKIYGNTFYNLDGAAWWVNAYDDTYPAVENNIFKNNIVYRTHLAPQKSSNDTEVVFEHLDRYYGDPFLGNKFLSNCVASDESASDQKARTEAAGIRSLSYYEANYSAYFNGNVQAAPQFVINNPVEYSQFELKDGSLCIDAGGNLTTTKSSGSGNVIPVADASYFTYGYGVIPGDMIMVGSSVARVTNVDIPGNKLTVDRDISWTGGAPVNLEYSGGGPDIGAWESGGTGARSLKRPNAPTDLH